MKNKLLLIVLCIILVTGCKKKNNLDSVNDNSVKDETIVIDKEKYEEIRNRINKWVNEEASIVYPKCDKNMATQTWNHDRLISLGVPKEVFLDVDGSSYCDSMSYLKCKNGKIEYETYLRCKDYKDKKYNSDIELK